MLKGTPGLFPPTSDSPQSSFPTIYSLRVLRANAQNWQVKLVYYAAHDTNLLYVAELLDLKWVRKIAYCCFRSTLKIEKGGWADMVCFSICFCFAVGSDTIPHLPCRTIIMASGSEGAGRRKVLKRAPVVTSTSPGLLLFQHV